MNNSVVVSNVIKLNASNSITKSDSASHVLQLMDMDHSYSNALEAVLQTNPSINKAELEAELDNFI